MEEIEGRKMNEPESNTAIDGVKQVKLNPLEIERTDI